MFSGPMGGKAARLGRRARGRALVDLQNVVRPAVDWKETFEVLRAQKKAPPERGKGFVPRWVKLWLTRWREIDAWWSGAV